jgi:8-oxo-dGTP diphosphatase
VVHKQKVLAYITRQQGDRLQVLVFDHVGMPEAGVQVPAGSLEPGEAPEQGVLREAWEESGLQHLAIVRKLGIFDFYHVEGQAVHHRHVFHLVPTQPVPERWVHEVSGGADDKGLLFAYYWLDVDEAARVLTAEMGNYLAHLPG